MLIAEILFGIVICLIIARINKSTSLFWKLFFSILLGIAIDSAVSAKEVNNKPLVITTNNSMKAVDTPLSATAINFYAKDRTQFITERIVSHKRINLNTSEVVKNNLHYATTKASKAYLAKIVATARDQPSHDNTS
jgi:hypothetical protein